MLLTIDIETIPADDPELIAEIAAGITHPANMSKAETIEKWKAEKKPELVKEAVHKTGLKSDQGSIFCIGFKFADEPAQVHYMDGLTTEAEVIEAFFASIKDYADINGIHWQRIKLCGHNINSFDIRFIVHRAWINEVHVPSWFPYNEAPYTTKVFDTMYQWCGLRDMISLDRICKAFGIEGKNGFDGSMVADAYAAGEYKKIANYCIDDVEKTYAIAQRMGAYAP